MGNLDRAGWEVELEVTGRMARDDGRGRQRRRAMGLAMKCIRGERVDLLLGVGSNVVTNRSESGRVYAVSGEEGVVWEVGDAR